MLNFPIIDTHVHLWDPRELNYWWHEFVPDLDRPFLPSDYSEACGGHDVEKMIFLECGLRDKQNLKEAEWVTSLAAGDPRIAGIVAGAPLENGEGVREDLDALHRNPLVKGVRRITQDEEDPAFCLQSEFIRGVQSLSEYGFTCDLCIFHTQLANTIELVEQCPDVRFVLDHIAKPAIKDGLQEPWKEDLKRMAALPNVVCKLSGLVTEADHDHWTRDELLPYIEHVVETFGYGRLMFGGDWPVSLLASTPPSRWLDTLQDVLSGTDESDLRKLFRENAENVYRV